MFTGRLGPRGQTPTASSSPVATASATPSPTPSPAPGFTRYTNAELGYSVDLPSGWRRATCNHEVATTSPMDAWDTFIGVPESEEVIRGGVRLVMVRVLESNGLTPMAWLERDASQPDTRFEAATLGGRAGARGFLGATGHTYAYAFAERGWIYTIEMTYFGIEDPELEQILTTLRILDDATVGRGPRATPVPRTIESLVDSVAEGFTKKDGTQILEGLTPCVTVGAVPGDPDLRSRSAYVTGLQPEFAAGTSIQVQSRPIETDPHLGRFVRSTWSKPGEPDQRVDLFLQVDGDRWSVGAILIRTFAN